jgi:APA family basic amino acid/polyamine antiporter
MISTYFAELVGMFPKAGGVYEFARNNFTEFPSFLTGWLAWLISIITIAMLVVGGLYYLLPNAAPWMHIAAAVAMIVFFSYMSYRGIKESVNMLIAFALITFFCISFMTAIGILNFNPANLFPFFTSPWPAFFVAIFFISETFFGWEGVTFLAEETKDADKVMPKVLVTSTAIMGIASILLVFAFLSSVHWSRLANSNDPFVYAANLFAGGVWGSILSILIFIAIIGSAAAWIISTPRLLLALSRDRLFIKGFEKVHHKRKTPHRAIIFQCIVISAITAAMFGSYRLLLTILVPLTLVLYTVVMVCVIKQRRLKKKGTYSSPFGMWGAFGLLGLYALLGAAWLFYVHLAIPIVGLGLGLLFSGVPAYVLVKTQDKKFVERFYNRFSILYDRTQPLWYGVGERKRVVAGLMASKGHKILDYGCATCSNTMEIANAVGREGKIVAVDIAMNQLRRGLKKIECMKECSHIILVKEEGGRAPFRKETFDSIVSVGLLGYQVDPESLLEYFYEVLKWGGRLSMLDFGKSFIFPALEHLKNRNAVKAMLERAGFRDVRIKEKRKLFTVYYYINARK